MMLVPRMKEWRAEAERLTPDEQVDYWRRRQQQTAEATVFWAGISCLAALVTALLRVRL